MIHPSGIQRPRDLKLVIKEVKKGLFIVENAYEGNVEYFPDRTKELDLIKDEDKTKKAADSID